MEVSHVVSFMSRTNMLDIDNNDGISVIDVTDPLAPSYCFVSVNGNRVPLSAIEYVRMYYPVPTLGYKPRRMKDDIVLAAIRLLDGVPMISLSMLAECWPAEYKRSAQTPTQSTTEESHQPVHIPSL